jgi:hypothetical protein
MDFFTTSDADAPKLWNAVARLLNRSWFYRVWTYQEKALSKLATVWIGSKKMDWNRAATAISLIKNHDSMGSRAPLLPNQEYEND